jgi:hypothetical protein
MVRESLGRACRGGWCCRSFDSSGLCRTSLRMTGMGIVRLGREAPAAGYGVRYWRRCNVDRREFAAGMPALLALSSLLARDADGQGAAAGL